MPRLLHIASILAIGLAPLTVGVAEARAAVDPAKLLRDAAAAAQDAQQLSAKVVTTVNVVMGENEQKRQEVVELRMGRDNHYSVTMVKPRPEFWVRSDGQQTMTYLAPYNRFATTDQREGVSDFAGSIIAERLGNGMGKLVFGLLDADTTEEVVESNSQSTYVGEETINDQKLHHCRYVSGEMAWDAWFAAAGAPLLVRLSPDVSEQVKQSPTAQQYENFSVSITIDLKDVDTESAIPAEAFALQAPEGAEQVEPNMLFVPPPPPPQSPHQLLGQKAPLFESQTPAGDPILLGDLIGKKVIILDFWATWCGPCVAAMPIMDKVAKEYAEKGVVLYAVNLGDDAETVTQFLADKELDIPVAMDPDSEAGQSYSVQGIPMSVLIGLDGTVQVVHVGLSANLEELLGKELDALLAKQDLAAETIAKWNEEHPDRAIER